MLHMQLKTALKKIVIVLILIADQEYNKQKQESNIYCTYYGIHWHDLISHYYHIRKYGAKPYASISHYYLIKRLFDTFLSLPNQFKFIVISRV